MLLDKFGRQITYVRLGITDKCNLRCTYCMPENGMKFLPKQELLSYEELERVVKILVSQGVTKVRLTGGEPFARNGLINFIEQLRNISSDLEIHITSNGVLLSQHIAKLESLGIKSINLSLDTLDKDKFYKITRRDEFEKVISTYHQLLESSIQLKVNMVVIKGLNEDDIIPMARLSIQDDVEIRFIEEMPFNGGGQINSILTHKDIVRIIESELGILTKSDSPLGSTSEQFKIKGAKGALGVIAAYSRTFCGSCNRIRLTPKGVLINCLYDNEGLDIRNLLRSGTNDQEIMIAIQNAITNKHKDGFEAENNRRKPVYKSMSTIGG